MDLRSELKTSIQTMNNHRRKKDRFLAVFFLSQREDNNQAISCKSNNELRKFTD